MSEHSPDATRKCAICGKPQAEKFKPFCSKRCADVDLSRWLKGNYAIPAEEPPDIGEDDEES
jgi:uncharacterized protein